LVLRILRRGYFLATKIYFDRRERLIEAKNWWGLHWLYYDEALQFFLKTNRIAVGITDVSQAVGISYPNASNLLKELALKGFCQYERIGGQAQHVFFPNKVKILQYFKNKGEEGFGDLEVK
jgi:hypothetical protein